jgi:protein-disulfide isomerase
MAMNLNETNGLSPEDNAVLDGLRTRISAVEPLVPAPPAWRPAETAYRGDPAAHSRIQIRTAGAFGFGGVLAIILVAAIIGLGLSAQGPRQGGNPVQTTELVYEVQPANGVAPTEADLATEAAILLARVADMGVQKPEVVTQLPNRILVRVFGSVPMASLSTRLGQTGRLEFVPMPPETYGKMANGVPVQGTKELPTVGEAIDPSLPVRFDDSQIDRSSVAAIHDETLQSWTVKLNLKGSAVADFASWSTATVGDFFSIALDGRILEIPYIVDPITNGSMVLSGAFTEATAGDFAAVLRTERLPFPVVQISHEVLPRTTAVGVIPLVEPSVVTPTDLPSDGRTLGSPTARVTLDVWLDYRCTACRMYETETQPKLIETYVKTGKARIQVHNLIVIDRNDNRFESRDAASAALCAADQGKYWVYQDWLFANQSPEEAPGYFTTDRLTEIARRAGLDMSKFGPCLLSGRHNADVAAESASVPATAPGTPTVYVNGGIAADFSYETVAAAIDAALAATPSPATTATPVPAATPTAIAPS